MAAVNNNDDPMGGGDASTAMNGAADDNDNSSHPFIIALEKDLVLEKILTFLNFEDMKILSEVSVRALFTVRKTTRFSKKARLRVCREVIQNGMLKECTYLWKHLILNLSIPIEILDVIKDMLESAESIYLELSAASSEATNITVGRYVEEILKTAKNLKCLGMNGGVMTKFLHDVFSNPQIQTTISKLESLDIYGYEKPSTIGPFFIGGVDVDEDEEGDVDDASGGATLPFLRNLLQLSSVPLSLKKLVFGSFRLLSESEEFYLKYVPNMIEASKETLEELELSHDCWKCEELKGIRCPKLKSLVVSTSGGWDDGNGKVVNVFLKNQPPLQELTICLKEEFPTAILLTLQGIGMLTKIKKLHLKAKQFVGSPGPVEWQFLETIPNLEDFALRKPYSQNEASGDVYGYGEDILNKLPSQVKRISLQGFSEFWKPDAAGGEAAEKNIGTLLARFENLTELNFLRSNGAVTDVGIQSIISNCPKLISLTFSHCPDVTDYGLSGVRTIPLEDVENEENARTEYTGFSLEHVTGLKHLKIRSCPNITPECLLNVVKFQCLESFDYYRNVALPKEFLFEIVKQNPCLERVALHVTSYEHDAEYLSSLKEEMKKLNRRVHYFELLEKSDWEDEDSDSDASSLEDFGNDSNISGGPRDPFFDDYENDYDDFSPADYDDEDVDYDDEFDYN